MGDHAVPDVVVAAARSWIGTPYRHRASLKGVGTDCLGLVRGVYRDVYGAEPESPPPYSRHSSDAAGVETMADAAARHLDAVTSGDFEPGDVLLFRWRASLPARHAGIAATASSMVHAHSGASVCEIALSPWWLRRLAFVFRFGMRR